MAKTQKTFEQALEELETIVAQIESGEVSLEQSIDKYADGMKLVTLCRGILDAAEKKIQLLSKAPDGSLKPDGDLEEE